MSVRSILFIACLIWVNQFWATSARAEIVPMRSDMCYAVAPATLPVEAASVAALPFDCTSPPEFSRYRDGWVWMKVRDPGVLATMPAKWRLLIDQARFDKLAVLIVAQDGTVQRDVVEPGAIGDHWAVGGMMRFTADRSGAHLADVYVGFRRLDGLSIMRKISAATPAATIRLDGVWLALMGMFAGTILSAFAYNLLIHTGQRLVFQRWYLVWSALVLGYGMAWTKMLAFIWPAFAGPLSVSANYLLVAGLISAGNMFFFSIMEEGMLPRWLTRAGSALAAINLTLGFAAAWLGPFNPLIVDRLLNLVFVLSVLSVGTGIVMAIRAGNRVVWFYLAGWMPVLLVFCLRVGRNFGLMIQDDTIDMATFAALAFESVALSLASADRFRLLGRERDAAEQARKVVEVESDIFRRAAATDFLTGLGNRAGFHATLRAMCDAPESQPFMLLLIDVDHLKDINDSLGHDGGDILLQTVGRGLEAATAGQGHVSRIGGDEFAILVPGGSVEQQRIKRALEELQGRTVTQAGRSWALSLSIGSAIFPDDADGADVLVKNADLALYQAKQLGRRRLQEYDKPLRAKMDRRRVFIQEAGQGMERGEFSLHYQPIVDLQSGATGCYEALLRWQHPVHGLMTPAVFGEMLNERNTGLAVQDHVLNLALTALAEYPELLPRLSVNLTVAQLDGTHAASRLLDSIRDHGVSPDRLCVEVTESVVLDRTIHKTAQALGLLHDAGVTVALDDFGTGYASLIHLKHLPFDVLKIDRSFTLGLFEQGGQSEEIIRAIIGLGHGLRKQVVAEGVETKAQRARLMEMGCHLGQGYLFARPAPIAGLLPGMHSRSFAA